MIERAEMPAVEQKCETTANDRMEPALAGHDHSETLEPMACDKYQTPNTHIHNSGQASSGNPQGSIKQD